MVESVRDYAIFMLDPQGNVVSWNPGAERMKGYAAEEIIGRHFSTFYTPEAVASGYPDHELEVAASQGRYEDEGIRVRQDGSHFYANVIITAVRDSSGELRGFAKVTRDITDRRRADEELREARAELERQRLSERQAIEINDNILQGLVVAKYALDKGDEAQTREAVEATLEHARRIISDLLAVVDVTPGKLRRSEGADAATEP